MYNLRVVVLVPKDRIRRALRFKGEIAIAISSLKKGGLSAPDGSEWELPISLKGFPTEADRAHLLKILDTSITWRNLKVWEDVMGTLCRLKSVNEIGMRRISAAIKEFSFEKVQPL